MDNAIFQTVTCKFCGRKKELALSVSGVEKRKNGYKIQDCFPELPAADRELLLSGMCGVCWDETFGTEGLDDPLGPESE